MQALRHSRGWKCAKGTTTPVAPYHLHASERPLCCFRHSPSCGLPFWDALDGLASEVSLSRWVIVVVLRGLSRGVHMEMERRVKHMPRTS